MSDHRGPATWAIHPTSGEPIWVPKVELADGTRLPYYGDADFVDIVERNGAPLTDGKATRIFNHIQNEWETRHGYTTTWVKPDGRAEFDAKLDILINDCQPCIAVTKDGLYIVRPALDKNGKLWLDPGHASRPT